MRKLLLLALLLYNIMTLVNRVSGYDYEDDENKRLSLIDERKNWRKKALLKTDDPKDWDGRRKHDYDNPRYLNEAEVKAFNVMDRQRELDVSSGYRSQRRNEEADKFNIPPGAKSSESVRAPSFMEKDSEKKTPLTMNCERQHERFEACFAGCASVTCDNPRDRLRPCYPFCEPGCICIHPYVRDDRTHKCVLPEECTNHTSKHSSTKAMFRFEPPASIDSLRLALEA